MYVYNVYTLVPKRFLIKEVDVSDNKVIAIKHMLIFYNAQSVLGRHH